MYSQRDSGSDNKRAACARVKPIYRNLIYQWALHLARALGFLHNYSFEKPSPRISIAFGDLSVESCWLDASGTHLSNLGFLQSTFRTSRTGPYVGMVGCNGRDFQPLEIGAVPTLETDVFLWGCVVYELMTGYCRRGRGMKISKRWWLGRSGRGLKRSSWEMW